MVGHSMVTIKRWLLRAHVMQKVLYQERYEISELTRDKMRIFLKLYLEFQDEAKRLGKVKQQVPVGTTMRPVWRLMVGEDEEEEEKEEEEIEEEEEEEEKEEEGRRRRRRKRRSRRRRMRMR